MFSRPWMAKPILQSFELGPPLCNRYSAAPMNSNSVVWQTYLCEDLDCPLHYIRGPLAEVLLHGGDVVVLRQVHLQLVGVAQQGSLQSCTITFSITFRLIIFNCFFPINLYVMEFTCRKQDTVITEKYINQFMANVREHKFCQNACRIVDRKQ